MVRLHVTNRTMRRSRAAHAAGAVAAAVSAVLAAPGGTAVGSRSAASTGSQVAWLRTRQRGAARRPRGRRVSRPSSPAEPSSARARRFPVVVTRGGWVEVISTKLRERRAWVRAPCAGAADTRSGRDRRRPLRPAAARLATRSRRPYGPRSRSAPRARRRRSAASASPTSSPASTRRPTAAASSRSRATRRTCRRGWTGGDRLAIHGGGGIAARRSSSGCLHASEADAAPADALASRSGRRS